MTTEQIAVAAILIFTITLQALLPNVRILVVTAGAAASCAAVSAFGLGDTRALLDDVPWDVIVILVALGLLTEVLVTTRVFRVLAVVSARWSRGDPRGVLLIYAVVMYAVSCLANNLTALLLVLPVLLVHLKLLGATQRYVSWVIGVLLVSCNLGGAATPIGDFPAILLLGRGKMTFGPYLVNAMPPTLIGLAVLLVCVLVFVRPQRGISEDAATTRLSIAIMEALHRRVRIDWRRLAPPLVVLGLMLVAWTIVPARTGFTPELICWLGVAVALSFSPLLSERILRSRVDVEAVLFLLSLFVMVAAVRRTGLFEGVARWLEGLDVAPSIQLAVFLLVAGVVTGLFSAGPSMAAMLDVAEHLARKLPPTAVYVGLALSVCAGSSLFLTAATSGPMAQALTERAGLRDARNEPLRFGFFEFLPIGLLSFAIIEAIALLYAVAALRFGFS